MQYSEEYSPIQPKEDAPFSPFMRCSSVCDFKKCCKKYKKKNKNMCKNCPKR